MVEYFLKEKLKKMNIDNVEVELVGFFVFFLQKVLKNVILVMSEFGIDILLYVLRFINEEMIKESIFILIMERYYKEVIIKMYFGVMDKVFILKEYVLDDKKELDVVDLYGGNIEEYRRCRDELSYFIDKFLLKVDDI